MDFSLDEAQEQLAASARRVVEDLIPYGRIRLVQEDPASYAQSFWKSAGKMGWLGLLSAPEAGGAGLGPLELVALQQELGRGVVPGPFLSSAVLSTVAIMDCGTPEQNRKWLAQMAVGDLIASCLLPSIGADFRLAAAFEADAAGGGFRITGQQSFVPGADTAQLLLVPARVSGRPAGELSFFAVDRSLSGVNVVRHHTIDPTRPLSSVRMEGVAVTGESLFAGAPVSAAIQRIMDMGRLALCAEMVGGAERALEMSVEYSRVRTQFGRPIGSFQALQHKCADVLMGIEAGRAMTYAAATSLVNGEPDASRDVCIAKAYCGDMYRRAAVEGVQMHGALGFTWDLDMQAYFKRAKASETLLGDARLNREWLAQVSFGGPS